MYTSRPLGRRDDVAGPEIQNAFGRPDIVEVAVDLGLALDHQAPRESARVPEVMDGRFCDPTQPFQHTVVPQLPGVVAAGMAFCPFQAVALGVIQASGLQQQGSSAGTG